VDVCLSSCWSLPRRMPQEHDYNTREDTASNAELWTPRKVFFFVDFRGVPLYSRVTPGAFQLFHSREGTERACFETVEGRENPQRVTRCSRIHARLSIHRLYSIVIPNTTHAPCQASYQPSLPPACVPTPSFDDRPLLNSLVRTITVPTSRTPSAPKVMFQPALANVRHETPSSSTRFLRAGSGFWLCRLVISVIERFNATKSQKCTRKGERAKVLDLSWSSDIN
jgi:hypothetical protein